MRLEINKKKKNLCKLRKNKAITLIALVITIILLLILAGVTINFVINGGILEKARTCNR